MKKLTLLFLAACMTLCLIPSVGMIFFPTTKSSENRPLAEKPQFITEDGSFNTEFFEDLQTYFNERVALRNQMVYTDAQIQTNLFAESNVSGVVYGKNDWLYYSSTKDDYLGRNILSERNLFNIAHNFSLVQEYCDNNGINFVLTIPPNKNTLYGENMPYYYSYIVDKNHNAELLKPYLEKQGVNYADMFNLFREQDEPLYLLRDSHWNMKGACLAYNSLMNYLGLEHNSYSDVEPKTVMNKNGDLNRMLYSFYGKAEKDYDYNLPVDYTFTSPSDDVEDGWLVTLNSKGKNSLLMFRDSFANTLIPFLSNEFETASYSKGQPNAVDRYAQPNKPDNIIIEIVERNITNYLESPPLMASQTLEFNGDFSVETTDSAINIEPCSHDIGYFTISGTVDPDHLATGSEIFVKIGETYYSSYQTDENSFMLYLRKSDLANGEIPAEVFVVTDDTATQVLSTTLSVPQQ